MEAKPHMASRVRAILLSVAAVLSVLVVYLVAYLFLRSFEVVSTLNSTMGTIGVVRVSYAGGAPQSAYPLSKTDAKFQFMADSGMLAQVLGGSASPTESRWYWRFFAPLERVELSMRGLAPVTLSADEEAELRRRWDQSGDEPPGNAPY